MHEKHNTEFLTIKTPEGMLIVPVYRKVVNENDEHMWTTMSVSIRGKEMSFDAETTAEVLFKFAKSLPDDWYIHTCLSCRYGHFCPIGNVDNELFCVTEFEPKRKSDLYFVTEDEDERSKRSRNFFQICDKYLPQVHEYFTYNDYLLEMDER